MFLRNAKPSKNSLSSSLSDLEETRTLLLDQIDRLQKLELKEKWKLSMYLSRYHGADGTYYDAGEELLMYQEIQEKFTVNSHPKEVGTKEEEWLPSRTSTKKDAQWSKKLRRRKIKEEKKKKEEQSRMTVDPEEVFAPKRLKEEEENGKKQEYGSSNLHASENLKKSNDKMNMDERVPLGHRNWKWNSARSRYHTYEQELSGRVLLLASQHRILGSNPITWLCDQDSVKYFMDRPRPHGKRLRRWWLYLSKLRFATFHIPGIKKKCVTIYHATVLIPWWGRTPR